MAGAALNVAFHLFGDLPELISGVTGVVHVVESIFHKKPKSGAEKKDAALTLVGDLFNIFQKAYPDLTGKSPVSSSAIQEDLSRLIDDVVKLANDAGVFAHSL